MAKQCRYAKKGRPHTVGVAIFCYCTSPANDNSSRGNRAKRSDGTGFPMTGYADGSGWWPLCIEGKDHNGLTPSRCDYYR